MQPIICGAADATQKDVEAEQYQNHSIVEKSFILAQLASQKLQNFLKIPEKILQEKTTDLISIHPSQLQPEFNYTVKLAYHLGLSAITPHTIDNGGASVGSSLEQAVIILKKNPQAVVLIAAGDAPGSGLRSIRDMRFITKLTSHPEWEAPYGATLIGLYGLLANRLLFENQLSIEHLRKPGSFFRSCAFDNPRAFNFQKPIRNNQLQKYVAHPYSTAMIALVSDHGFATLIMSPATLATWRKKGWIGRDKELVYIKGTANISHTEYLSYRAGFNSPSLVSGPLALYHAGLTAQDIDYAWIYDCFTGMIFTQAANIFSISNSQLAESLSKGNIRIDHKEIPINRGGGILNYQAAMSLSTATGLLDVLSQFALCPQPLYPNKDRVDAENVLITGNGGIDSVSSVTILGRQPASVPEQPHPNLMQLRQKLSLNQPEAVVTGDKGVLYSASRIHFNPGGERKPPYSLAIVKTDQGHFRMVNLFANGRPFLDIETLPLDKTPIRLENQDGLLQGFID